MNCQQLASRIERLQPGASPREVARLCLLLSNQVTRVDDLDDEEELTRVWKDIGIRLQAAADQHAAMTAELDELASSSPKSLNLEQVWVLIRAVKVQSQVLQLYVGREEAD